MAKIVDISILGDKQLQRKLRRLATQVQKKIVKKALREAGRPVLAAAQQKAPVGKSGRLKKSLKLRARKQRRGEFGVEIRTGTRTELGIAADASGFYPMSIEYGFTHARSGQKVPAQSFLRAAIDENARKAKTIIISEVRVGLTREAMKP